MVNCTTVMSTSRDDIGKLLNEMPRNLRPRGMALEAQAARNSARLQRAGGGISCIDGVVGGVTTRITWPAFGPRASLTSTPMLAVSYYQQGIVYNFPGVGLELGKSLKDSERGETVLRQMVSREITQCMMEQILRKNKIY